MRRVLIERARRRQQPRRGGGRHRVVLSDEDAPVEETAVDLLALDEALERLHERDAAAAELVKLRYFAGLTVEQTASVLDLSPATVKRYWTYARAWLIRAMTENQKT